jgi:hypothetical protein
MGISQKLEEGLNFSIIKEMQNPQGNITLYSSDWQRYISEVGSRYKE